jgi:hypothetical protein
VLALGLFYGPMFVMMFTSGFLARRRTGHSTESLKAGVILGVDAL